jgi:hypothetical protein
MATRTSAPYRQYRDRLPFEYRNRVILSRALAALAYDLPNFSIVGAPATG